MSETVEQLHYTWARRGVEGVNRFQIAALSPGLKAGPSTRQLPALRRLCQYERPRGYARAPVSFGWLDHAGVRIAFWRIALDALGKKPRNFAVHLLLGSPGSMPESELALRFNSPFWWDGADSTDFASAVGPDGLVLPAITLADVPLPEAGEHPASADALAGALLELRSGDRLSVDLDSWELGRSLRAIAGTVPEALDGVSVSTFETRPVVPFRLLGGPAAPSTYRKLAIAPGVNGSSCSVLARMRASPKAVAAIRAISHQGIGNPDQRRSAFWAAARALIEVASGSETSVEALLAALSRPAGAAYVASEGIGRDRIVDALLAGSAPIGETLREHGHAVDSADVELIAEGLAAGYRDHSTIAGCAQAVAVLTCLGSPSATSILEAAGRRACDEPGLAAELTVEDVSMLIAVCRPSADPSAESPGRQALVERGAQDLTKIAVERTVPDHVLMEMLRAWLPSDTASGPALVCVLRARPDLIPPASLPPVDAAHSGRSLGPAEQARCVALLRELHGDDLSLATTAVLPAMTLPESKPGVEARLRSLGLEQASQCLLAQMPAPDHKVIAELCDQYALRWLDRCLVPLSPNNDDHEGLHVKDRALRLAAALAEQCRSTDTRPVGQLLRSLASSSWRDPVELIAEATRLDNQQLGSKVALIAVDRALSVVYAPQRITRIWDTLVEVQVPLGNADILKTLLESALRRPRAPSNVHLMLWIATILVPCLPEIQITKKGMLCNPDIQQLCSEVARNGDNDLLSRAGKNIENAPDNVRRWWRDLVRHGRFRRWPAMPATR